MILRSLLLLALAAPLSAAVLPPEWTDPYGPTWADECRGLDLTYGTFCVEIPTGSGPDLPLAAPVPEMGPSYYAYFGFADCLRSPQGWDCRGHFDPKPGLDLPGYDVCACQVGVLWQETNGREGLQRYTFYWNGLRYPDHMMLV